MNVRAKQGLLFGALGAAAGVLLSGAISIEAISALAEKLRGSVSGGPLFALGGFAAASLGLLLGARSSYADRNQRHRYLLLTIGTLALIVLPASLLRMYGLSPLSDAPTWLAASLGILALAAIAFVAALPRLKQEATRAKVGFLLENPTLLAVGRITWSSLTRDRMIG